MNAAADDALGDRKGPDEGSKSKITIKSRRGGGYLHPPVQGATVLHCLARLYRIEVLGAT
jgi:hypothetical protein